MAMDFKEFKKVKLDTFNSSVNSSAIDPSKRDDYCLNETNPNIDDKLWGVREDSGKYRVSQMWLGGKKYGEVNPKEEHKLPYYYPEDNTNNQFKFTPDFLMKENFHVVDNEEDFEKCKGYLEENPPIYGMGGIVNGDSDGNGAWKKGYINSTVGIGSSEWVYNNVKDTIDATNNTDFGNYYVDVEPHYYINNIANIGYFKGNGLNDSIGVIFYTEFTGEDGELYCDYLTVECGNRVKSSIHNSITTYNSVNVGVARRKKLNINNNDASCINKYFQLIRSRTSESFEKAPYLVRGDELVKVTATGTNQTYFTAVNTVKKGKTIAFYFSEKAFDLSVANKQQDIDKNRSIIFDLDNYTVQINGYSNDGTNTPFTLEYDISTTPMSYNADGTQSTILSKSHPTQWVGGDDITDVLRNIAENGCFGYYQASTPEGRVYNIQYIEGENIVYNNLILRNDTNEVYELNGSTFDMLSGSTPIDYFTGSHISYNEITEKLWYSNGTEITQIATNCDCDEGGDLFCPGSGITFIEDNEDCVTINSNALGVTVEDIICSEGAPVDGRGLWDGGDIIPSGTTLQEILVKLLCRELFPNQATKPNINLQLGSNGNLYIQEIGASVTIPSVTISEIDGKFNSGNYSTTQPSPEDVKFSGYTITSKLNSGFSGYTEIDETNDSSGFTISATTASVLLGSNKITFDGCLYYTKPSNMPITNLGNPTQSTSKVSTDYSDITAIWPDSTATKTLTVTAEGVYPVFINTNSEMTSHINSNVVDGIETANFAKLPLTKSNEIEFNEPGEENIHLIIDFPKYYNDKGTRKERNLNIYVYNAMLGEYVSYTGGYNVEQEFKHNIYGKIYEYKRLEFTGDFVGKDKYKLVFNASLNK